MSTVSIISLCLAALFSMAMTAPNNKGVAGDNTYVRGCYYTNWAQYRPDKGKYVPENYVPGLCTHVFYAFVVMNNDFTLKAFEWNDEDTDWSKGMYTRLNNMKQQQPDLKTILSFGGWTFSQGNKGLLSSMASNANSRTTFISSVIQFVRKHNFDGFDIDWEYPEASDKVNFATLVQETRAAFEKEAQASGKPRLLLTAAVAAGIEKIDAGYDGKLLGAAFDYINIMSYDFHGGWEQKTGFNSPLYDRNNDKLSISNAAEHWHAVGVPKSKILLGLGTYGRGWTLASAQNTGLDAATSGVSPSLPYAREAGMASYYEICDLIEQKGYKEYYDDAQQSPYIVGGDGGKVWIGYDNVKSFGAKVDWVKKSGYAGAFVWALDFDDFTGQLCKSSNGKKYPLMSVINEKLGGASVPDPQPTQQPQSTTKSVPPTTTQQSTSKSTPKPNPSPTTTTKAPQTQKTTQGPRTTQPQTKSTSRPSGPFSCPGANGIFPDPASCESFYMCSNGTAQKLGCPKGLAFNEQSQTCDWPSNVKCGSRG